MSKYTLPSRARALSEVISEAEEARPEDIAKLRELCRRHDRPMLAEPFTRQRVKSYTIALSKLTERASFEASRATKSEEVSS